MNEVRPMDASKKRFGGWLAANVVSFFAGFVLGTLVLVGLLYLDTPRIEYINPVIMGVVLGLVVGFGQYLALRDRLSLSFSFLWIIAWAVGLSAGFLGTLHNDAYLIEPFSLSLFLRVLVTGMLAGGIIGFLQWFSLRKGQRQAWRWIPWNVAAGLGVFFILLFPTVLLVSTFGGYAPQLTSNESGYLGATLAVFLCLVSSPLAGLLTGGSTWAPLRRFLREHKADRSDRG